MTAKEIRKLMEMIDRPDDDFGGHGDGSMQGSDDFHRGEMDIDDPEPVVDERPVSEKLWDELTDDERYRYEEQYILSIMRETDMDRGSAELYYEGWLNSEGWSGRDARIMQKRDAAGGNIYENAGCNCGDDCKCGGKCGGKCGDKNCPCECGSHTGAEINESIQLNEGSVYEESKFICVLSWYIAESGMPGKHKAADVLKEKYPEALPWEWKSAYSTYLRAIGKK
jgi:hypothetical protein